MYAVEVKTGAMMKKPGVEQRTYVSESVAIFAHELTENRYIFAHEKKEVADEWFQELQKAVVSALAGK